VHKEQEIRNQIAEQFKQTLDQNKKQKEAMLKKALETNRKKYEAEIASLKRLHQLEMVMIRMMNRRMVMMM